MALQARAGRNLTNAELAWFGLEAIPFTACERLRTAVPYLRQGSCFPALRVQGQTSTVMSGKRWKPGASRAGLEPHGLSDED